MSKNYEVIHYIQKQLNSFEPKFVDCVKRCFNRIEKIEEPDGCLSNTVALYVCAKEYGYDPKICYGLCELNGLEFYHAWLEIDGTIIDVAIYGNVNYSPYSLFKHKRLYPYIGNYEVADIKYGRFSFDEDWEHSRISKAENWLLEEYIDKAPMNGLWKLIFQLLDKTYTRDYMLHLKKLIENVRIEIDKDNEK